MWIFLNNAMLSIVQKPGDKATLTVRARVAGDIERVFPAAKVVADAGTDYKFRARISRAQVANAITRAVMDIDYGNFKGSIEERHRHDAYMDVWSAMMRYQNRMARPVRSARQRELMY